MANINYRKGNTNAVKHGQRSDRTFLLPGEDEAELARLHADYERQFQPRTPAEEESVSRIVALRWRQKRADRSEVQALRAMVAESQRGSKEQRNATLLNSASAALAGLIETIPALMHAPIADANRLLAKSLPPIEEALGDLVRKAGLSLHLATRAVEGIDAVLKLTATGHMKGAESFRAPLVELQAVMTNVLEELQPIRLRAEEQLEQRLASLSCGVSLSVSEMRRRERYSAATERAVEHELQHLRQLRELGSSRSSFGRRNPALGESASKKTG